MFLMPRSEAQGGIPTMKNYVFATMLVVAALLMTGVAHAAVVLTSPTLGGPNQARGVTVTSTFTISDSAITQDTPVTVALASNSGYSIDRKSTRLNSSHRL